MKAESHAGQPSSQTINDYSVDHSSKTLILGFALIIFIGTLLLMLPIATESRVPLGWREALFTATSATTVTGLVVMSTVDTFSTFGEMVILLLIQVGGMGFMVFSVLLLQLIGRRIALNDRMVLRQSLGVTKTHGIVRMALGVLTVTLAIEFAGAILLFFSWLKPMGAGKAAYYAVFHSISAFCNAGFDLFRGTEDPLLLATRRDPIAILTLSALIIIGTMGIVVIFDLMTYPRDKQLSLHSKLIIPLMIALTLSGTIFLLLDEAVFGGILSEMPRYERWLTAFFTVVSSRTAGITIIPIQDLGQASQLVLTIFMFIGGAPASMGGGIGLTTVAVVLVTLYTNVRGYPDIRTFGRTLPVETVVKAVAITTVSMALVLSVTLAILLIDGGDIVTVAFEVVSAFSNTGYSLGITGDLNQISRGLLVFTMFWGRLGPLTLVVGLAKRGHRTQIKYPEERIIIG